jgi:hypothetical protein
LKIEITYKSGKVDVFDTNTFTAPTPFSGTNMLTNFELQLDALSEGGLWLCAHSYDASATYREQTREGETPTAHRKRGWRFLLAEASEVITIEEIVAEDEVVATRVLDELINMRRLNRMCATWLGSSSAATAVRLVQLFDRLSVIAAIESGQTPEETASQCGCSLDLIYRLKAVTAHESQDTEDEEQENWMEGIEDEIY